MAEKTKKRGSGRYDNKKKATKSTSHWFRNSVLISTVGNWEGMRKIVDSHPIIERKVGVKVPILKDGK